MVGDGHLLKIHSCSCAINQLCISSVLAVLSSIVLLHCMGWIKKRVPCVSPSNPSSGIIRTGHIRTESEKLIPLVPVYMEGWFLSDSALAWTAAFCQTVKFLRVGVEQSSSPHMVCDYKIFYEVTLEEKGTKGTVSSTNSFQQGQDLSKSWALEVMKWRQWHFTDLLSWQLMFSTSIIHPKNLNLLHSYL